MKPLEGFFCRGLKRSFGKAIFGVLLVLLIGVAAQAQHEADNWIFGNQAGLNFSSTNPVAISFTSTPAFNTQEGSSSISDQSGNLLFYTDGRTVWNKNNQQMPNGHNLLGGSSATQSALIVPWPNSECHKYFVFTVEEMGPQKQQRLSYSVVDMTLAGGLGDIVLASKNTILKTGVSEKLASVKDSSVTGFWVGAHGFSQTNTSVNKDFYIYHVTSGGVIAMPPQAVGSAHQNSSNTEHPSSGQMKISSDGKQIACAVNSAFVEILNFDTSTGAVTGPAKTFSALSPPFQNYSTYGLEFSADSKLLYVSTVVAPSKVYQLVISSSSWTTLLPTGVASPTGYDIAQLQLGPDGKIYVARDTKNYLSVITSPNTPGSLCNFTVNGPALSPGSNSRLGLPTMIGGSFSCAPTPTPTPTPSPDPCCPPWNQNQLTNMMSFDHSGSLAAPYTVHFVPTPSFKSQMQTYINYLNSMNSAISAITITWSLHNQGTGNNPNVPLGPQIPNLGNPSAFTTWNSGGSGNPTIAGIDPNFFKLPTSYPMVIGTWYRVHTGIYLENGQKFFPDNCAVVDINFKILVQSMRRNELPVLEISDGKDIIKRVPIKPRTQ